jgi:protein-disulfide isomerase
MGLAELRIKVGPKDHVQGTPDAEVTLVEYGDYECPHCGETEPIIKRLQKYHGKHLRLVFRNFPLSQMHPDAEAAAEAAEYAGSQGKFWEMHDLLLENQDRLGFPLLIELAVALELSPENLQIALERRTFQEHVQSDFLGGVRSGVKGTPTFYINGHRYDGPRDYASIERTIESARAS